VEPSGESLDALGTKTLQNERALFKVSHVGNGFVVDAYPFPMSKAQEAFLVLTSILRITIPNSVVLSPSVWPRIVKSMESISKMANALLSLSTSRKDPYSSSTLAYIHSGSSPGLGVEVVAVLVVADAVVVLVAAAVAVLVVPLAVVILAVVWIAAFAVVCCFFAVVRFLAWFTRKRRQRVKTAFRVRSYRIFAPNTRYTTTYGDGLCKSPYDRCSNGFEYCLESRSTGRTAINNAGAAVGLAQPGRAGAAGKCLASSSCTGESIKAPKSSAVATS